MVQMLARHWWLVVLRGVVAILFGILAFVWPAITIGVLVILFGAYAIVDGVSALITGFRHSGGERWWMVLEGLAGVVLGVLTFIWPGMTALILLVFIAVWAILTGIFEIVAAIRLRAEIEGEWALAVAGVLSVILGIIMLVNPGAGALALIWAIAAYAIVFGAALVYLGFKLRSYTPAAAPV